MIIQSIVGDFSLKILTPNHGNNSIQINKKYGFHVCCLYENIVVNDRINPGLCSINKLKQF